MVRGKPGSVVAVVPAAGSGERLAAGIPKAFCELDGRTLVERAVAGLLESGVVDHVVVAVPADRIDQAKLVSAAQATVVAGGADRTESVSLALSALSGARNSGVRAGARRRAGADTTRVGRAGGRRVAGRSCSAVVPALPLLTPSRPWMPTGWSWARRSGPACAPCRPRRGSPPTCCCALTALIRAPVLPISPTTRPWSSMSAARFRWSTATRWRSRSPPSWICLLAQAVVRR